MNVSIKKKHYWQWGLLAITVLLWHLLYFGIGFPVKLEAFFVNNLTYGLPDSLTWFAWLVLFIGLAKILWIPYNDRIHPQVQEIYDRHIYKHMQWLLISIIIIFIAIGFNQSLVFLIMTSMAHGQAFRICEIVSSQPLLRKPASMIKRPIGLSLGWLIFQNYLAIANIPTTVSTENYQILILLLGIIIFTLRAFYLYIKLGNPAIYHGLFWGILGLLFNQSPFSSYHYKNQIFFWALIVITILSLIADFRYSRMYRQQEEKPLN